MSERNYPPELSLLLTCAHSRLFPAQQERLPRLLTSTLDWVKVFALAQRHGLLPLFYWQVANYLKQRPPTPGAPSIPPSVWEQFARHYHSNNLHSIKLGKALGKLMHHFANAQIPLLALKGVALAQAVYANPALRDVGDLDLLVDPADALRAMTCLQQLGYQPQAAVPLTPNQQTAWVRFKSELHYRHPEQQIEIDLHWGIADLQSGFALEFAQIWARRSTVWVQGDPVFTLGPEDGLLYLTLHGAKHGWVCLKWVCDIAEYVRAHPALTWPALQQQAAQINATTALLQGLTLAQQLLECELPAAIAPQPTLINAQYMTLLLDPSADRAAYLYSARQSNLRLAATQSLSFWQRLWQNLKVISTPTGAEIQLLNLPARLVLFYYPLRLGRLLWEFCKRQKVIRRLRRLAQI